MEEEEQSSVPRKGFFHGPRVGERSKGGRDEKLKGKELHQGPGVLATMCPQEMCGQVCRYFRLSHLKESRWHLAGRGQAGVSPNHL